MLRDLAEKVPGFRHILESTWRAGPSRPQGPGFTAQSFASRPGWTLAMEGWVVRPRGGGEFNLWSVDQGVLCDMISADLWLSLCRDVGMR